MHRVILDMLLIDFLLESQDLFSRSLLNVKTIFMTQLSTFHSLPKLAKKNWIAFHSSKIFILIKLAIWSMQ